MKGKLKFHVEHNVKPTSVTCIVSYLAKGGTVDFRNMCETVSEELWSNSGTEVKQSFLNMNLRVLEAFNIVSRSASGDSLSLTPLGNKMAEILGYSQKLFFDLIHYLYYSTWVHNTENKEKLFSWTYKEICDLLWMQDDKHIDDKKIIGEVYDLASSKFGNDDIALSPYAVNGVKNWLLSLDPSFLKREGRQVIISSSRNHCSLELVLLAIDLYYVSNNISYGTPILMRPGKARAFANTCLLDENSVEDLIELSVKMFKELLRWQSSTWGRSLILRRQVDILELQGLIP